MKGVKAPAPPVEPCFHKDDLQTGRHAPAPHQARHWQQAALVPNVFGFVLYRLAKKLRFVAKFGTWRPNATWFAAASKFHDSDGGDRRGDETSAGRAGVTIMLNKLNRTEGCRRATNSECCPGGGAA